MALYVFGGIEEGKEFLKKQGFYLDGERVIPSERPNDYPCIDRNGIKRPCPVAYFIFGDVIVNELIFDLIPELVRDENSRLIITEFRKKLVDALSKAPSDLLTIPVMA